MAPVGPFWVIFKLIKGFGAADWVTAKVRGVKAGTLGSEAVTANVPGSPDVTVWAPIEFTTGAKAALTVTVVVAVFVPQPFDTVRDRFTTVLTTTTGAV